MIKAVIFDIDGVLLDSFGANLKFYQNLFSYCGYEPPTEEVFKTLFHLSMMDVIKAVTGLTDETEIKRIWEIGRGQVIDYPLELLTMPEGAEETIQTLNQTYVLGLVTSRIRESVYEFPGLAKLRPYFKTAVAYQDTAHHKPHPEPLLTAAKNLGVTTEESVYIGDVATDIEAARNAGMKVITYAPKPVGEADAYTSSFEELSELIASL